jgi:predicted solute-binding protein
MTERPRLGVTEAFFLKPLLEGLDAPGSPFELTVDLPSSLAVAFNDRPESLRGAFLSPIDYARHGSDYHIVPGLCVSSSRPTGAIRLYVNDGTKNITRLAVDIRVTSEIILAKIILLEKFPNLSPEKKEIQFIPMMPDLQTMLKKADAALVANFAPAAVQNTDLFCLDLVEEWNDLTTLPYVHGFWVVREGRWKHTESRALVEAQEAGRKNLSSIASRYAFPPTLHERPALDYLTSFSYTLAQEQEESVSEFLRYCYFHGALGDIPELNFASNDEMSSTVN